MAEVLKNSAASTLSAAITSTSATTCTVANGTVFPATGNFRILIDSELMLCTSRSGTTLTVTRGVESTTAATHSNGATVTHVLTTGGLDQYIRENALTLVPAARVYHNANQSIADTTIVALAFNSERFDSDTIHDTSTNNSRLTCKTAGVYDIKANVSFASSAAGSRQLYIRLNGTTDIAVSVGDATASGVAVMALATHYTLAVTDYVEATVLQNSGGALNVLSTGNYSPEFSMARVA